MKPKTRPKISLEQCEAMFDGLGFTDPVCVFGIRGYFQDTMGKAGENDRGMYDDAIGVYAPGVFVMFNGNVDPSRYRKGKGKGSLKGMASLKTGVWRVHQLGLHKGQYTALVQTGGKVTVVRDGNPPYEDTGYFGINIHKGSVTTTSSEGCQTLPPDQWLAFIELVKKVMKDNKLKVMPYVLCNECDIAPKVLPPT